MDLNHVSVFVQVVEKGGFTAAAEAVGLPKSSVSRSVAKLEQDLGVTLLRRTTRSVTLTDAGKVYYERARTAVQQLAEAGDIASDAGDEPRGLIRLTAPADFTGNLFVEPLARFLATYPKIELDLILTGRHIDLVTEGVDLALRAGRLGDSSLIAKKVANSALGLFASPAYLERRGKPKKLADLARHDCIVYRGNTRWTLEGPRGAESVDVTPRVRCDELGFVMQACAEGIGVAMIPMAGPAPADTSRFVRILPDLSQGGVALYLVHPPMRHLPRRVALLRDFLFEELRKRIVTC